MALTRLKQLREEAVLTVHELAAASGVSDDTISKIENGQRVARPNTLRKLARALNVSPQELRRPAKTEELAGAGKAEAPREAGQAQTPTKNVEEFEQALARVLEPVRTEALAEQQAANRFLSSEGRKQDRVVDPAEAEAGKRFVDEFSPDEIPTAIGELSLGYARFERDSASLREALTQARKLLQERSEKIAQLEAENAQLREEAEQERVPR